MKTFVTLVAAIGCLAGTVALTTPADAYVVKKVIHNNRGPLGHGCRTVRTRHGNGRVVVRKVCR